MKKDDGWTVALNVVEDFGVIAAQAVHSDSGYQSCQPSAISLPGNRLLGLHDDRRERVLLGNDDPGEDVGEDAREESRGQD